MCPEGSESDFKGTSPSSYPSLTLHFTGKTSSYLTKTTQSLSRNGRKRERKEKRDSQISSLISYTDHKAALLLLL